MHRASTVFRFPSRPAPLAAAFALAFAASTPALARDGAAAMRFLDTLAARAPIARSTVAPNAGASITVTRCDDGTGAGTLRNVIAGASSGDIVDLSTLACSRITLDAGQIAIPVDNLTLRGPASGALSIAGNNRERVFEHTGAGTLEIDDLTITLGRQLGLTAYGGCVYSKGSIVLRRATIASCVAQGAVRSGGGAVVATHDMALFQSALIDNLSETTAAPEGNDVTAAGGAAIVSGAFSLASSRVSGNTARANRGHVYGGGTISSTLLSKYSEFSGNTASSGGDVVNLAGGGGALQVSSTAIVASTFDHNIADVGGGMLVSGDAQSVSISQSTFSSNTARLAGGGFSTDRPTTISNSTIAFNQAGPLGHGGAFISGTTVQTNSSIFANNFPTDFDGATSATGAANVIRVVGDATAVPAGTFSFDPKLGPLADNGGPTRTHALAADSSAIDAGNDLGDFIHDQRGVAFKRVVGVAADIGAFEFDPDRIFGSGFD